MGTPANEKYSNAVAVSDWLACFNATDNMIVLSCTVTAGDSDAGITGVGLILSSAKGKVLASLYVAISGGEEKVSPSLNLDPGELVEGDDVLAVAQGECDGQHFFFEQQLTIGNCSLM